MYTSALDSMVSNSLETKNMVEKHNVLLYTHARVEVISIRTSVLYVATLTMKKFGYVDMKKIHFVNMLNVYNNRTKPKLVRSIVKLVFFMYKTESDTETEVRFIMYKFI